MQWSLFGSVNGGSSQVIASQTTAYGAGVSAQIAGDVTPLAVDSGGPPMETISYYNSTTFPAKPVYTETVSAADDNGVQNDSETGIVAGIGVGINSGNLVLVTTFDDSNGTSRPLPARRCPTSA